MGKVYKFWIFLISIIGVFCLGNFVNVLFHFGRNMSLYYYFWLALFIVCVILIIGITVSARSGHVPPKWITIPVEILVGIGFLLFIIIEAIIVHGSHQEPPAHADYLIALGAKVNGTQPSLILKYRIDAAAEYLRNNPETIVIASGGKGADEGISEAQCIYQGLVEQGIDAERIIIEDQSTSTVENLTYSAAIIMAGKDAAEAGTFSEIETTKSGETIIIEETVVLTTTDFHLFRAVYTAKKLGYTQVYGNSAKSVWWLIPSNYLREFFAVIKAVLF